jgi:hypothetical protein
MATLKLLSMLAPEHADGSHHVRSPGGYEVWHFYAEDSAGKLRAAIGFHDGFALHPEYVNRYAAYRRHPTRNAPPTASEYPYLQIRISEDGKLLAESSIQFPPKSFLAGDDGSQVLGTNRVEFNRDEIKLTISDRGNSLSAEFSFRPILEPAGTKSFSALNSGESEHHWIPARPLCQVQGEIRAGNRAISFSGLGQHNHYYGTEPILWQRNRSMRGSVLFPHAAVMFQSADDRAIVLMVDQSGIRTIDDVPLEIEWKRFLIIRPPQPVAMRFGERLIIRNPRVVATLPGQIQLLFDAYIDGEQATAWVEIDSRTD